MDQQTLDVLYKMLLVRTVVARKHGNKMELDLLTAEGLILDAVKIPKKSTFASRR